MAGKFAVEKGEELRKVIARLLHEKHRVLSTSDIVAMVKDAKVSRSTSTVIMRTITSPSFTKLTQVKVKKIELGHGMNLIYDDEINPHNTNMREKLQSMLTDAEGNPVTQWRRNKIVNAANTQGLKLD